MFDAFKSEARYYDAFHADKDYAAEAESLRKRYPSAKRVLEIGAGTGLLTRELERLGFSVTAVEPSTEMRQKFLDNNPLKLPFQSTIQGIPSFPVNWFDLTIAHYDVLNYVPFDELPGVLRKLLIISKQQDIEIWDSSKPVKFFTMKRVGKLRRFRFAFRFGQRVTLFFVYTGKGLCVSKHKLYLHEGLERDV